MDFIIVILLYGCLAYLLGALLFPPVLRWPLAILLYIVSLIELILYFALRYLIFLLELFRNTARRHRALRQKVRFGEGCNTFEEWEKCARELDILDGREEWKDILESPIYNYELVQMLLDTIRTNIAAVNKVDAEISAMKEDGTKVPPELLEKSRNAVATLYRTLQTCMKRNVGAILNESLYSQTNTGTKRVVVEFIAEIQNALYCLGRVPVPSAAPSGHYQEPARPSEMRTTSTSSGESPTPDPLSPSRTPSNQFSQCESLRTELTNVRTRLGMLADLRRAFGHTALCLSGGGGLGLYHLGHVRALRQMKLLPKIISGTSAGALVAAHICCRTDEELELTLNPEALVSKMRWDNGLSWFEKIQKWYKDGYMFDTNQWVRDMRWHTCGDMTFLEAYKKTGRSLVISATSTHHHEPPVFMSHITTPNVLIWSAIIASASVPGLLPLARLYEKDEKGEVKPCEAPLVGLRDGSFKSDIPTSEMAFYFNAGFFIVAQVNPHIAPFFFFSQGDAGRGIGRWVGWRGGYVLSFLESFLKNELRKNVSIMRDMGLLPTVMGADWSYLFLQNFEGHITLVPQIDFKSYLTIITSPTVPDLYKYFKVGEMTVYRKASLMRTRLLVCNTLTEVTERLSAYRRQVTKAYKAALTSVATTVAAQQGMRVVRPERWLSLESLQGLESPRVASTGAQSHSGLRADDMDFVLPSGLAVDTEKLRPERFAHLSSGNDKEVEQEESDDEHQHFMVESHEPHDEANEPRPNLGVPKRDHSAAEAALRSILAVILENVPSSSSSGASRPEDQPAQPGQHESRNTLLAEGVAAAGNALDAARSHLAKLLMLPESARTKLAALLQGYEEGSAEDLATELTRGIRRGTDAVATTLHELYEKIRAMPDDMRGMFQSHSAQDAESATDGGSSILATPLRHSEFLRRVFLNAMAGAGLSSSSDAPQPNESASKERAEASFAEGNKSPVLSPRVDIVPTGDGLRNNSNPHEIREETKSTVDITTGVRQRGRLRSSLEPELDEGPAPILSHRDGSRPRRGVPPRSSIGQGSTEYVPY